MDKILSIHNLSKRYENGIVALSSIDVDVKKGELVTVIGSSGSGKSTLLRCINRLVQSTSGEIYFEGKDICTVKPSDMKYVRRKIGMIFQHYNLVGCLTVMQNVLHGRLGYMGTLAGICGRFSEQDKTQALSLLQKTGLEPFKHNRAGELSGGQKQRVGIVRALMQNPSIMLCDEPIASLDPVSAKRIMDLIRNLTVERGITCIVNLHQVEIAKRYASRVIGLKEGRIVFDGTPAQLTSKTIDLIYGCRTQKPALEDTLMEDALDDEWAIQTAS
jgi:phosphonate transport system ATP-binding protein